MWRYGYTNPVNYNDNELYCGGFSVQWQNNDGKCGVCGDNWAEPTPRRHEVRHVIMWVSVICDEMPGGRKVW